MAQQEELEPGDLVRLKSGSPYVMTVGENATPSGSMVYCYWFDDREVFHREFMPAEGLVKL